MPTDDIGTKIKELRLAQGLTLEQVGDLVGVGKSTVRKWETGMIVNMRRDKVAKLAYALQTTPAYLMGWDDDLEDREPADELESISAERFGHFNVGTRRIKERRKALCLSAETVAERLGKNKATMYRYENGSIGDIPASIIYKLAKILHTSPAYLMGWVDIPDSPEPNDTGAQTAQNVTRDELFDAMLCCAGYNRRGEDANVTAFKSSVAVDVTPELVARVMEQTVAYFEFLLERESATR